MFHAKSVKDIIREFSSSESEGLAAKEIRIRLSTHGENILPTKKPPSLLSKFLNQFKNVLVLILIAATVISFFLGDTLDAAAIAAIVILNAVIGFLQEIQAEKTLSSLKQKDIWETLVLREGRVEKINSACVVPGDILILEEGGKIPADARILESFSLRIDESILTGESQPASKNNQSLSPGTSLADRMNMVYRDTAVLTGRGKALVVATGGMTEIGKIAAVLEKEESETTPLTREINQVGNTLTILIGIIALGIFSLNMIKQVPFVDSLLISISLAVAAIPEGLPAIVTIVLSLGVKRMADRKAIIRKLAASETLGAVRIIASDKTGTLTQNKINTVRVYLRDGSLFAISGEGYNPKGIFFDRKKAIGNPLKYPLLEKLARSGVLASNANLTGYDDQTGEQKVLGDTTEGALLVFAQRAGLDIDEIRQADERIYEVPFTSERKMMSALVKVNDTRDHMLYAKGAPEEILKRCRLAQKEKEKIMKTVNSAASEGLRSLAIAQRHLTQKEVKTALEEDKISEENLEFLGLTMMQDPLRSEVRDALDQARTAGIRTIMITGDHANTAKAIAMEAGIIGKGDRVLLDEDVLKMTMSGLTKEIQKGVNVFARISPMGKLKIIRAIKRIPHTQVAVTGDGVNDAPALKASHIGVAMGRTGTDLTREVADLVITDDNYATIVTAIREGRVIFANLVKFIRYLISCNLSEVLVISASVLMGLPLPLLPIQILWINLVTDGMPALALGVDPPEFDVMKRPPRDLSQGILHRKRWAYMLIEGLIMGGAVLGLFVFANEVFSYQIAQTMTFTALTLTQLIHAFSNRSSRKSLFQLGIFSNRYLVGAALFSFLFQYLAVHSDFGQLIFKTRPLDSQQWLLVILIALIPFFAVETKKQLRFRILP